MRLKSLVLVIAIVVLGATSAETAHAASIVPDRTFSSDGRVALNAKGYDDAADVVVDGDISYVVGSTRQSQRDDCAFLVAKYGGPGQLIRSFGSRGKKLLTVGNESCAFSGALTPDGGILVAGWSSARKLSVIVVKLRPTGRLDRSFARNGILKVPVTEGITWPLVDAAPDGSIWLAWAGVKKYDYDAHESDYRVMHFTPRGRVDRTFGGDGLRTFDVSRRDFTYFSTVDADGRFYLVGHSDQSRKSDGATALLSVAAGGRSHVRTIRPWGDRGSFPLTVDVDVDGLVVVGMSPYRGPGWGAARYTSSLELDRTFGRDGYARHDCRCYSSAGTLTPQGLVLVGGTQTRQQKTVLARFTPNGRWDRAMGNDVYDLFPDWEYWVEAEVDSRGRVVLVGSAEGRPSDATIARFRFV